MRRSEVCRNGEGGAGAGLGVAGEAEAPVGGEADVRAAQREAVGDLRAGIEALGARLGGAPHRGAGFDPARRHPQPRRAVDEQVA